MARSVRGGEEDGVGGLSTFASLQHQKLYLRGLGTVGGASSLALAAVLAGMLRVAATLPLTVILAFAGVFGKCRRLVLRDQDKTGIGGWRAVLSSGLGIEAGGCSAKKPGECGREGQVVYGSAFHEKHLS